MRARQAPSWLGKPINDEVLCSNMRAKKDLGFLRPHTVEAFHALGDGLANKRDFLLSLWPKVLTDAILFLKKHDKREFRPGSGIDPDSLFDQTSLGVDELRDLLRAFSDFEPMLYGASAERYRDHVGHPFRVWMLGHLILEDCLGGNLLADDALDGAISRTERACMWAIAALCHDLGYPLEGVEFINKRARTALPPLGLRALGDLRFGFSQQMVPFHDTVIRLIASRPVRQGSGRFLTHLQNKYYLKFLKSFDLLGHGLISSLLVAKALVYFLEADFSHDRLRPLKKQDARQYLVRREILRAMASHTCRDIYHLRFDTLSFLLYLVDEMQTWGRPTLTEAMSARAFPAAEQEPTLHAFGGKALRLSIAVPGEEWPKDKDGGWIRKKLNGFHQVLRLAMDTPSAKDLRVDLRFVRAGRPAQHASFLLRNGRISKEPSEWYQDGQED